MNRRTVLILILLSLLTGTAALAYGTWCCLDWMARRHVHTVQGSLWTSESWPRLLDLNSDQRSKIAPLEKSLKKDMDRLQIELTQKQIALCRTMMSSGKPDAALMHQTMSRISALQGRKDERMMNHLLALREILNPEQQKKLFTTMMKDICQGCRAATDSKKDYCGLCNLK